MSNSRLVEQVTKIAVASTLDYLEKERQKQEKLKNDNRLRNTKLLLKNYRSFKLHCNGIDEELDTIVQPGDIKTMTDRWLIDRNSIAEFDNKELAVQSIKKSIERTANMVKFIDRMLLVYSILCETSKQPEDMRRYKIIHSMYIADEKLTAEEIATCHVIDVRSVYRDINIAANTLSTLIFGVDSIQLIK